MGFKVVFSVKVVEGKFIVVDLFVGMELKMCVMKVMFEWLTGDFGLVVGGEFYSMFIIDGEFEEMVESVVDVED